MKVYEKLLVILMSVMMICGVGGCGIAGEDKYTIELESVYEGEVVDLCNPIIREYLNASDEETQLQTLLSNTGMQLDSQEISFAWTEDEEAVTYTVYFADNEDFENPITFETLNTFLDTAGCFVPGKTYYWKVVGDAEGSTSKVDSFQTLDAPVRYITTEAIPNVRDIGGWKTEEGKKVKYEMLYRAGKTNYSGGNECMPNDKELFADKLGIKVEIDLRRQNQDDYKQTESVFGEDVRYYKSTYHQYNYIFPDFKEDRPLSREYAEITKTSAKEIFELLADEDNYPILYHCNAGADRTGTLTFLINGLLGVSYEDLTKDFEITTFSEAGPRIRGGVNEEGKLDDSGIFVNHQGNYVAWDKMYESMMETYGTGDGKLSSAIENYLINVCGIEQETIESIRNIMLED